MTPEYLRELADLADPDQLWRLSGLDQMGLPPEKRRQLDMGVALRRHASHVEKLRLLLRDCRSLLITPLSLNGSYARSVESEPEWRLRQVDYCNRNPITPGSSTDAPAAPAPDASPRPA